MCQSGPKYWRAWGSESWRDHGSPPTATAITGTSSALYHFACLLLCKRLLGEQGIQGPSVCCKGQATRTFHSVYEHICALKCMFLYFHERV